MNTASNTKRWLTLLIALSLAGIAILLGVLLLNRSQTDADPTNTPMTLDQAEERLAELRIAVTQLQQGDSATALLAEIQAFADASPTPGPAYELLGNTYLTVGNAPKAYDAFATALTHDPDLAPLHQLAGVTASKAGRADDAIRHHGRAVELDPNQIGWQIFLANAYVIRDAPAQGDQPADRERAKLILLNVLQTDDTRDRAYYQLARLALLDERHEQAQQHIDEAITRLNESGDPTEESYATNLSQYMTVLVEVKMAQRQYEQALGILNSYHPEPDVEPLLGYTARCYFSLGRPELAAGVYELRFIAPDVTPDDYAAAADWRLKAGHREEAASNIQRLAAARPHHPDLPDLRRRLNNLPQ